MAGTTFIERRRLEGRAEARLLLAYWTGKALPESRLFLDLEGIDGAPDGLLEIERRVWGEVRRWVSYDVTAVETA